MNTSESGFSHLAIDGMPFQIEVRIITHSLVFGRQGHKISCSSITHSISRQRFIGRQNDLIHTIEEILCRIGPPSVKPVR